MPTGMRNARTAIATEVANEMRAHQWVATLKTPMSTKNRINGATPTSAVAKTFPATAVVEGVKAWKSAGALKGDLHWWGACVPILSHEAVPRRRRTAVGCARRPPPSVRDAHPGGRRSVHDAHPAGPRLAGAPTIAP